MATEITVPRLGWSMEEGVFAGWLKPDGATIRAGDLIYTLEGEKAAQEIEALDQGVLAIPPSGPTTGQKVLVGEVIGYLLAAGETPPWKLARSAAPLVRPIAPPPPKAAPPPPKQAPARAPLDESPLVFPRVPDERPAASPRARRLARELRVDLSKVRPGGRGGRIREEDVRAAARGTDDVSLAPARATWRAESPAAVIELPDTVALAATPAPLPARAPMELAPVTSPAAAGVTVSSARSTSGRLIPHTAHRRAIAARMSASAGAVVPVTLVTKVDATNLVAVREQFRARARAADGAEAASAGEGAVPRYSDLFVKLAALALRKHPLLLAQWRDDGLWIPEEIDVALAVDSQAGLLAPVIHGADRLSLRELVETSGRLTERARQGRLSMAELEGATFTVSSLGRFGVDAFTPIVSLPQSSVLGVGRIVQEPAVHEGQIVPRWMATLSLTFDHRCIDGAPAARCLQELSQAVTHPAAWLI